MSTHRSDQDTIPFLPPDLLRGVRNLIDRPVVLAQCSLDVSWCCRRIVMTERNSFNNSIAKRYDSTVQPIAWWLRVVIVLGAFLTAMGGIIALVHPAMLVSPHDEINGAVHIYAGYLAARNLALAIMLVALLLLTSEARAREFDGARGIDSVAGCLHGCGGGAMDNCAGSSCLRDRSFSLEQRGFRRLCILEELRPGAIRIETSQPDRRRLGTPTSLAPAQSRGSRPAPC